MAAGSSATFKVGTDYEQLIGKLLDAEGDPGEETLFHSREAFSINAAVVCDCKELLQLKF